MADEPIVAIGLLTSSDLERLGATFTRLWPVDQTTGRHSQWFQWMTLPGSRRGAGLKSVPSV